jgi:hypothetical protein
VSRTKRTPDQWETYRMQARAEYRSATAFRVGMLVGRAGANLPSPYHPSHPATHRYLEGVKLGRAQRAEAAQQSDSRPSGSTPS